LGRAIGGESSLEKKKKGGERGEKNKIEVAIDEKAHGENRGQSRFPKQE